jgi:hypothetical protein
VPPPAEHGSVLPGSHTTHSGAHIPSFPPVPALARGPILAIAATAGLLLMLLSGRYGYVTDELYFLAAGKYHLDWGYVDQQPLVPLLAAGIDAVFPGSLFAFRLPAMVATVLGVVATALIAREFGGGPHAQVLAAAAYPLSPWLLLSGHWLAPATVEPLQWSTILWLLVRWVRLHEAGVQRDRLLLWIGLLVTVALYTKFQIVVLCVALLISVAAVGPRALLRRPTLWVGAAITLVATTPTLLWQAQRDWPALDMAAAVDRESDRLLLLPQMLLYSGLLVGAVLCCYGLWRLFRAPELVPYRFLAWTVVGVIALYIAASGRANYLAGAYGLLFAVAGVGLERRQQRPWKSVAWPAYLLSALFPIALLPIYPLPLLARHPELPNYSRLYETGWPELTHTVARTYHSLPPNIRNRTAIVGESYYLTGALDVYGRGLGLPRAYSPHRGYWFFGAPPDNTDLLLYVGNGQPLKPYFGRAQRLATVKTDLVNLPRGDSITLYEAPAKTWSELWPDIRTM